MWSQGHAAHFAATREGKCGGGGLWQLATATLVLSYIGFAKSVELAKVAADVGCCCNIAITLITGVNGRLTPGSNIVARQS
jgi:hypothetical protein